MNDLDFEGLSRLLLTDHTSLLPRWLPGGRVKGNEYTCADVNGGNGDSFKVNIVSGKWADFADSSKGGDFISLYARIHNLTNGAAYHELAKLSGFDDNQVIKRMNNSIFVEQKSVKDPEQRFIAPPKGTPMPKLINKASFIWRYLDKNGCTLFLISRYDLDNGKKTFKPWSFTSDGEWVNKAWRAPRPLYNLPNIYKHEAKPILIVEGEKAADAARDIVKDSYIVTTWHGGANAWAKTDFTPIYNRRVLIWPDADKPGNKCADEIAEFLQDKVSSVKMIDVSSIDTSGYDAFDALNDGMTWESFVAWGKENVYIYGEKPSKSIIEIAKGISIKHEKTPLKLAKAEEVVKDEDPDDLYQLEVPEELTELYEALGIKIYQKGAPVPSIGNTSKLIEFIFNRSDPKSDPKTWRLWFDVFHQRIFTTWRSNDGKPRTWNDRDDLELTCLLEDSLGFSSLDLRKVTNAVTMIAHRYMKHEIRDYFDDLTWDKTPRVKSFLTTYLGVRDSQYARDVSNNFLISMIARIYDPGCKVDNMLMIEGKQGLMKTSAIEALATTDKVLDTSEKLTSKEFKRSIRGKWVIELAELESLKGLGPGAIKQHISAKRDWDRNPYEVRGDDYNRECIFIGTTNTDNYLIDNTGARRFWPVKATKSDVKAIKEDRDQILAEALNLYNSGESWWEEPNQAKEEQDKRNFIEQDAVYEKTLDYVNFVEKRGRDTYLSGIKLSDVLIKVREDLKQNVQQSKVKSSLISMGFERSETKIDGYNLWHRKASL